MGRVARFRKLRAIDPFNKNKPKEIPDEEVARAPSEAALKKSDTPRKLKDLKAAMSGKRVRAREDDGESSSKAKKQKPEQAASKAVVMPTLEEGESLSSFNWRVDEAMRDSLLDKMTKVSKRRKRRSQTLKERQEDREQRAQARRAEKAEDKVLERLSQAPARFGDRMTAPPKITAVPRTAQATQASRIAGSMLAQQKLAAGSGGGVADPVAAAAKKKQQSTAHTSSRASAMLAQQKAARATLDRNRTAAQAAMLANDRERVIAQYRARRDARHASLPPKKDFLFNPPSP